VFLGEPGAGKTRLLEHWHATWLRALGRPRLGTRVPVLVRLRDLPREVLAGDPAKVADEMWVRGLAAGRSETIAAESAKVLDLPPRLFAPVWLLDGLDELAAPLADAGLWEMLRALPGEVVLTCRTAVFQPARAEATRRIGREWRILGLEPAQQSAFLAGAYTANGVDPSCATTVVRDLNANSALRPLATVPLLLELIAEAGDRLVMPANRAAFYEEATAALWERRLRDRPALLDLTPERDAALAAIAGAVGLNALEAKPETLRAAGTTPELREAVRRTGLLRFDDRRGRVAFPHVTFQEFHLARYLLARPFSEVLEEYWADVRYEETLALLIALRAGEGQAVSTGEELRTFVTKARERHAAEPSWLWSVRRSPLRTVLHLLGRAAVGDVALPITIADLPSSRARLAIARDNRMPVELLAELGGDPEFEVHWAVARNRAAPAEILARLARDRGQEVRQSVAKNPAAPAAVLAELARAGNVKVRTAVGENPTAPAAMLAELARANEEPLPRPGLRLMRDSPSGSDVCRAVAANSGTPAEALARLAHHSHPKVRQSVAANRAAPAEALAVLGHDPDLEVCLSVAANPATPAEMLACLANHPKPWVRTGVALNPGAPVAILDRLARDPEARLGIAMNPAAPMEALATLGRDPDLQVRRKVAGNPAAVAEVLAVLEHDPDLVVRQLVARNPSASAKVLTKLGSSPNVEVRRAVARNRAAPAEVLVKLGHDPDLELRRALAQNRAAPAEVLAGLAHCPNQGVRWAVARHPTAPAKVLAELARDPDELIRTMVALNPATLLEDLVVGAATEQCALRDSSFEQ
jgi:hypothetical protein